MEEKSYGRYNKSGDFPIIIPTILFEVRFELRVRMGCWAFKVGNIDNLLEVIVDNVSIVWWLDMSKMMLLNLLADYMDPVCGSWGNTWFIFCKWLNFWWNTWVHSGFSGKCWCGRMNSGCHAGLYMEWLNCSWWIPVYLMRGKDWGDWV